MDTKKILYLLWYSTQEIIYTALAGACVFGMFYLAKGLAD